MQKQNHQQSSSELINEILTGSNFLRFRIAGTAGTNGSELSDSSESRSELFLRLLLIYKQN